MDWSHFTTCFFQQTCFAKLFIPSTVMTTTQLAAPFAQWRNHLHRKNKLPLSMDDRGLKLPWAASVNTSQFSSQLNSEGNLDTRKDNSVGTQNRKHEDSAQSQPPNWPSRQDPTQSQIHCIIHFKFKHWPDSIEQKLSDLTHKRYCSNAARKLLWSKTHEIHINMTCKRYLAQSETVSFNLTPKLSRLTNYNVRNKGDKQTNRQTDTQTNLSP